MEIEYLSPDQPDLIEGALTRPTLLLCGRRERLLAPAVVALVPESVRPFWGAAVEALTPGDAGDAAALWAPRPAPGEAPQRVVALLVPEPGSRYNCPARPHAISALVGRHSGRRGDLTIVLALDQPDHALAAGCAVARAFPIYNRKTGADHAAARKAAVLLLPPAEAPLEAAQWPRLRGAAEGVRLAARLADTPAEELGTDELVAEAQRVAAEVGAAVRVLQGEELRVEGLGGLYHVGRAATRGPALVILSHAPPAGAAAPRGPVVLVGKGIVYDTGGLSMKGKTDMPGMKVDMGGAAAVLAAFRALATQPYGGVVHALLCLAENAVGPRSIRPDDILTLYSGKTVEINNTDAEGRLVLADGVAYAVRHLQPEVIIDIATLTGAQLISTGKRMAAVVSNDEAWEQRAVQAGRRCGDLVHPLPYAPELYRGEFKSQVADLKNSVKDRANAQSACAAQFIAEHLGDYAGAWLHIDMAGPVEESDRATGYGVALLLELLRA